MNQSQHERIKIVLANTEAAEEIIIHVVNNIIEETISHERARILLSAVDKIIQVEAISTSLLLSKQVK